jgi:hypothetical protein
MPDRTLACLPLEALSLFQGIPLVSRDFSLHYHFSRTQDHKSSFVRRKFGCNTLFSIFSHTPDIVDPYNEGSLPATHPSKCSNISDWFTARVVKSKAKQPVKGWEGITGTERWPSAEEWQQALLNSNAFVYWGHGQMMSHVDPCFVSVLALQGKFEARVLSLIFLRFERGIYGNAGAYQY